MATSKNQATVMADPAISVQWLKANKVEAVHTQMKSYREVSLRLRFLKGFCPATLKFLLTTVASKWGELGLASKPFPVNRSLLMSPEILTSAGFTTIRDKESVPAWRDGAAGSSLQMAMVIAVDKRMFEYELYKTNSEAFRLWT